TPTASGTFTITITATNAIGSTDQTFTFTVNQVAAITSVNSTRFALDEIDSFQVTASGFPAPAFSTSSTLPNGITLSSSGVLSGEPTNAGTFTITIVATNGIGAPGTQTFTLTVVPPVVFTPLKIADGQVAASYSQQLTASGPAGPFTFRLASGTLPAGLTLNPNGAVRGSPSQAGTFTITAAATNGTADTGSQSYTFTIIPAPVPLSISGAPDGSAVQFLPNKTGSFALGSAIDPFANTGTSSRTAVADVNGDGVPDTIFVTGPGTPIRVAVENGASGSLLVLPFDPFGGNFLGGGFVAAGDFDGDGRAEFVITPDQGGGPRVSIFSLSGFDPKLRANYFTVDPNFRGGARAAVGDINGDHIPDLAVAAGFGGGPRVAVINGIDALTTDGFSFSDRLVGDFFAFGDDLRNGVYLAIGDVDGDGFGDLIFGAGPGGGPEVLTISGQTLVTRGSLVAVNNPISNFFVGGSDSDRSGVRVTTTDADRDNLADVVVATGADVPSGVRVYLGKNFGGGEPSHFQDLDPFQSAVLADGVFVG
ncbi:MAG TPA: putative Ig domain-containing protein, partial [Urbifossiella sp.]|nr:putative Ig domain-containing protein [Urbifossiella sp.]